MIIMFFKKNNILNNFIQLLNNLSILITITLIINNIIFNYLNILSL